MINNYEVSSHSYRDVEHQPSAEAQRGRILPETKCLIPKLSKGSETQFWSAKYEYFDQDGNAQRVNVIIKEFLVNPNLSSEAQARKKALIQEEIQTTLKLCRLKNVGHHFVYAFEGSETELILEDCEGQSLSHQLISSAPNLNQFKETVDCVGEGLSIMHEMGLIHGDVKPQNILYRKSRGYGRFKQPKLADFHTASPKVSRAVGTPAFMPPEVFALRDEDAPDPISDYYAFCTSLYGVLTNWTSLPYGEHQRRFYKDMDKAFDHQALDILSNEMFGGSTQGDEYGKTPVQPVTRNSLRNQVVEEVIKRFLEAPKTYVPIDAQKVPRLKTALRRRIPQLNAVFANVFSPDAKKHYPTMRNLKNALLEALELPKDKQDLTIAQALLSDTLSQRNNVA